MVRWIPLEPHCFCLDTPSNEPEKVLSSIRDDVHTTSGLMTFEFKKRKQFAQVDMIHAMGLVVNIV